MVFQAISRENMAKYNGFRNFSAREIKLPTHAGVKQFGETPHANLFTSLLGSFGDVPRCHSNALTVLPVGSRFPILK
jgi:hypothetical protein